MNKKKPRKKSSKRSLKNSSNIKLINIFLLIFLIASIATIASYYTIKNKDLIKDIPTQTTQNTAMEEIKEIKEQSLKESFEEKFQINEENKFEEYTNELEKVILEKADIEESINKENEIVQKKS